MPSDTCTFLIDQHEIKSEKQLLAKSSPVFEKMLYGEFASDHITITDIKKEEFEEMLMFISGSDVSFNCIQHAWSLLYIAHKYELGDFEEYCQAYIAKNLALSNILLCYEYSEMFGLVKLKTHILREIENCLLGVFELGDYHMKPSTLVSILGRKTLHVCNSELVQSVLRWAVTECDVRDITLTPQSIMQLLNDEGVMQHLLGLTLSPRPGDELYSFFIGQTGSNRQKRSYQRRPWFTFCKSRTCYKIAGRTVLKDSSDGVHSCVCVNSDVALFGLVVMTEDKPLQEADGDTYFGKILITICDVCDQKNTRTFSMTSEMLPYEQDTYVPFDGVFVMEAVKNYMIKVEYRNFDTTRKGYRKGASVLCHYMNRNLEDKKKAVTFTFDEMYGSVIKGVCYYRI